MYYFFFFLTNILKQEIELELTTNKKKIVFPKKFSSTTVATIDESIVQQVGIHPEHII